MFLERITSRDTVTAVTAVTAPSDLKDVHGFQSRRAVAVQVDHTPGRVKFTHGENKFLATQWEPMELSLGLLRGLKSLREDACDKSSWKSQRKVQAQQTQTMSNHRIFFFDLNIHWGANGKGCRIVACLGGFWVGSPETSEVWMRINSLHFKWSFHTHGHFPSVFYHQVLHKFFGSVLPVVDMRRHSKLCGPKVWQIVLRPDAQMWVRKWFLCNVNLMNSSTSCFCIWNAMKQILHTAISALVAEWCFSTKCHTIPTVKNPRKCAPYLHNAMKSKVVKVLPCKVNKWHGKNPKFRASAAICAE